MTSYADHLMEDRRLVILRLLKEAGATANESVLHVGLGQIGHRVGVTRDVVRQDLRWLQERDLVTLDYFDDRVVVATLTGRGLDCSQGHVLVKGVAKPSLV